MFLYEKGITIPRVSGNGSLLGYLTHALRKHIAPTEALTRFVITKSSAHEFQCDIGLLDHSDQADAAELDSPLRLSRRNHQPSMEFNAVLVVPTGVGCEIGGHAGDANPVAALLATACDTLITHPNVVNASDIMELPSNGMYVEGSVLSRLLMGTAGLQRVKANRVIVVIDEHQDENFTNASINAVSAARACYGMQCPGVVRLSPPIRMAAKYTPSGRAAGRVEGLARMQDALDSYRGEYDAVAIASVVDVPKNYHMDYFQSEGKMINPWGGVEAMLTHWISMAYDVPSAHSPMLESEEVATMNPGIVDSRIAAEAISGTYMQCILKGLHRSPRIITDRRLMQREDVLSAEDISCLVIPDGCLGIPTLAALEQGITVIAVRENKNMMENELSELPWAPGQFYSVENYWEACGVILALRSGLAPESVRRPLAKTIHEKRNVIFGAAGQSQADEAENPEREKVGAKSALGKGEYFQ